MTQPTRLLTKKQRATARKKAKIIQMWESIDKINGVAPWGTYVAIAQRCKVTETYVRNVVKSNARANKELQP